MQSAGGRKYHMHAMCVEKNKWTVQRVLLSLLCCGQQHKQTDEAVLQSAEVLQGQERVKVRKPDHDRETEKNNPGPERT